MPRVDGIKALKAIRDLEKQKGVKEEERVKIIMITALNDTDTVFNSFKTGCEAFAAKPIDTQKLLEVMKNLGLEV